MVEIGDLIRCPKCGNYGRVVWVSKDGQTAGVRCSSRHRFTTRRNLISTPTNKEIQDLKKTWFLGEYIAMRSYLEPLNHSDVFIKRCFFSGGSDR